MRLGNIIQCATIALPLILANSDPAAIFGMTIVSSLDLIDITSPLNPHPAKECLSSDHKTVIPECNEGQEQFLNLGFIQLEEPSKEPTQFEITWLGNKRSYNISLLAEGYYVYKVDGSYLSPMEKGSVEIVCVEERWPVKLANGTVIFPEETEE